MFAVPVEQFELRAQRTREPNIQGWIQTWGDQNGEENLFISRPCLNAGV